MRQAWITRAGPPDILRVREAPDPSPCRGDTHSCQGQRDQLCRSAGADGPSRYTQPAVRWGL